MRREFTPEEIAEISANPNTHEVTKSILYLTREAKEKILLLHDEGHSSMHIFKALGYNTEVLGENRIRKIVKHVEEQSKTEIGIHEGYKKRKPKRMELNELGNLNVTPESFEYLKTEVIYLRQEVDFLKKLSQLENMKKRGS